MNKHIQDKLKEFNKHMFEDGVVEANTYAKAEVFLEKALEDIYQKGLDDNSKKGEAWRRGYQRGIKEGREDGVRGYAEWEHNLITKSGSWWSKVEVYLKGDKE